MHPAIIGTVRSLIVDVAMGQIPRSTERISSLKLIFAFFVQEVNKPNPHVVTVLEVKGYGFSDFYRGIARRILSIRPSVCPSVRHTRNP